MQFRKYFKIKENPLSKSHFDPNEPIELSIRLESDTLVKPTFIKLAQMKMNRYGGSHIEYFDNVFACFEKTPEYSDYIKDNNFKQYYFPLKKETRGLFRDALLSSGSLNLNCNHMTALSMKKYDLMDFMRVHAPTSSFFLDTNALLYHFVFILEKYEVDINKIKWHIPLPVIWELENLGKKNVYDYRKAKSAFRDISNLINKGVLTIESVEVDYKYPDDKLIRKYVKNSILQGNKLYGSDAGVGYLITYDYMMALAAYAEGIRTIQIDMPLIEQ